MEEASTSNGDLATQTSYLQDDPRRYGIRRHDASPRVAVLFSVTALGQTSGNPRALLFWIFSLMGRLGTQDRL